MSQSIITPDKQENNTSTSTASTSTSTASTSTSTATPASTPAPAAPASSAAPAPVKASAAPPAPAAPASAPAPAASTPAAPAPEPAPTERSVFDDLNGAAPVKVQPSYSGPHISNVYRDGDDIKVIVYKVESHRKMEVYYEDTGKTEIVPYQDGMRMFDITEDGGKVSKIIKGAEKRVYATATVSVNDIDLSGLTWEPRTKKRKGADE